MTKSSRKMYRPDFSTVKDVRVLQTRKAVRRALLELLKASPIDKISIKEIVATADIGYNTFFRHYPDKESILEDVAAEEIRQLVSLSVPVLEAQDTLASCLAVCNYVEENKKLWKTLLTGGAAGALREEFVRLSLEVAETRALGKDWLPLDLAVIIITGGTFELLAWWLSEADPQPADSVARIYHRIIVSPVIDP